MPHYTCVSLPGVRVLILTSGWCCGYMGAGRSASRKDCGRQDFRANHKTSGCITLLRLLTILNLCRKYRARLWIFRGGGLRSRRLGQCTLTLWPSYAKGWNYTTTILIRSREAQSLAYSKSSLALTITFPIQAQGLNPYPRPAGNTALPPKVVTGNLRLPESCPNPVTGTLPHYLGTIGLGFAIPEHITSQSPGHLWCWQCIRLA